jgi:hypothetical protein
MNPFLGVFAELRKSNVSFVMPACVFAWNNWASIGQISMTLVTKDVYEILP